MAAEDWNSVPGALVSLWQLWTDACVTRFAKWQRGTNERGVVCISYKSDNWSLSYFSLAVTTQHGQGNLQKKAFSRGSRFQRVSPWPSWWIAWWLSNRHDAGATSESFHLILKRSV